MADQEPSAREVLSLDEVEGRTVSRIELVGLIRITFDRDPNWQLVIESLCEITGAGGTVVPVRFAPAERGAPTGLDALGALYNQVVESAMVVRDGSFRIVFQNGSMLSLPVDPDYEAGHFVLGDRYIVVPPGGRQRGGGPGTP